MNQHTLSPDDPRLTAYALGEMPAAERAEFEQLLAADPQARQAVDDIRAAGDLLGAALEHEPAPALTAPAVHPAKPAGKVIRFPHFYYVFSGLAAACFAVFFSYWQQNHELEHRQYVELNLAQMSADGAKRKAEVYPEAVALPPPPAMAMALPDMVEEKGDTVVLSPFTISPAPVGGLANALQSSPATDSGYADAVTRGDLQEVGAANVAAKEVDQARRYAAAKSVAAVRRLPKAEPEFNTEAYRFTAENGFLRVADQPLSTFSIDVDTASYANVRRFLLEGRRPPTDAVRLEEMVNYFPYAYQPPTGDVPFSANLEVASAPWAPEHRLVRIGLKGREVSDANRPAANLVFLIDVSGSMQEPNKLPLVKQSLRLLVNKLRADDHVALAVYAGASGLALPSTPASHKADILEAIDRLEAGGSTNGAMGIELAYDVAKANFVPGGVNRVILATDGDFNVGTTSEGDLTRLITEKAKSGVFLSVLGFGMGNYKDSTLELLADKGNGNYAYIDSLAEAKKTLVEQAGGTLVTIAKDVKIQVEFNPAQVRAYRLLGYENRLLAKEDFNNDKIDAGEIGAGHTVTALYEVVPAGAALPDETPAVDALKYQKTEDGGPNAGVTSELLTVAIRYKEPAADFSRRLEFPLRDGGQRFEGASTDFKFAAAVAGFGMLLRESPHKGSATLADITAWAQAGTGTDTGGYRTEFVGLTERAAALLQ